VETKAEETRVAKAEKRRKEEKEVKRN